MYIYIYMYICIHTNLDSIPRSFLKMLTWEPLAKCKGVLPSISRSKREFFDVRAIRCMAKPVKLEICSGNGDWAPWPRIPGFQDVSPG